MSMVSTVSSSTSLDSMAQRGTLMMIEGSTAMVAFSMDESMRLIII
jgi:hypothetical protein